MYRRRDDRPKERRVRGKKKDSLKADSSTLDPREGKAGGHTQEGDRDKCFGEE